MSIAGKYRKSLDENWCLRFKTRHPEGDPYDGIVTQIKRSFIVLREEQDFDLDGINIFPKKSICGYRDGEYERCCNEILRENGALRKARSPNWMNKCETLPDVIKELKKRDIWPGVESIFNGSSDTAFYIGPITCTADDHFNLRCYDAAGKWEQEYKLIYNEIFRIEIDSKYCSRFSAHMRKLGSS